MSGDTFDLDRAIDQLIELGEKDPGEIARLLELRNGRDWIAHELLERSEQIVSEIARRRLGESRRQAIMKIEPRTAVDVSEVKMQSVWVPNLLAAGVGGYKRMADCTADDFDARAAWLEHLAGKVRAQATWFRELADRMRVEGTRTFKGFKGELPMLPPDELEAA